MELAKAKTRNPKHEGSKQYQMIEEGKLETASRLDHFHRFRQFGFVSDFEFRILAELIVFAIHVSLITIHSSSPPSGRCTNPEATSPRTSVS